MSHATVPRKVDKKEIEELLSASQTVLQKYQQNPERIGCPPREVLEQLANFSLDDMANCSAGKTPPDRATLFHILAECYPCYTELLQLRGRKA